MSLTNLVTQIRESILAVRRPPIREGEMHAFPLDLAEEAANEIERLQEALQGLSDMYARTWDRVDGALVMMPDSVARFEAAHKKASIALGQSQDEPSDEPAPDLATPKA